MSLISKEKELPKTIEYLYLYNEELAAEIFGSSFYYGDLLSQEEWIKRMTVLLNSATKRGYSLAKRVDLIEDCCGCLSVEYEDHPYNPNRKVGEICEVCGKLVKSECYL
jgi:arginyl-tRNA--protein-N-Asp/Glu arginylyltransferase